MRMIRPVTLSAALLMVAGCKAVWTDEGTVEETATAAEPMGLNQGHTMPPPKDVRTLLAAQSEDPGAHEPVPVTEAFAVLTPTEGNKAYGGVRFWKTDDEGLRVVADVWGLPEGTHAFHVHLYGDCSGKDGETAGPHFNFQGSSKNPPDDIKRITGNLGELKADSEGHAHLETTVAHASLRGAYSILGRAVIVHAKANDPSSPPTGAAGARLACGTIGIAGRSGGSG